MKRSFLIKLFAVPVLMFGFGYLMVPLYDVFCDVTGLNGKSGSLTRVASDQDVAEATSKVSSRRVEVQFLSIVNQSAPWQFKPKQFSMQVELGKPYTTTYVAQNLLNQPVISQSVPSVSPSEAATHFNKMECFCFTEQAFTANEQREMPLTFVVDPSLPEDVDTITLSYTLFTKKAQEEAQQKTADKSKETGKPLTLLGQPNAGGIFQAVILQNQQSS